ncbi:aroma-sacti cluster domain-containing protein [Streptomyces sp. RFCAC02]|uniref:aroma-sacti cluster domain-containing protein n=1 Tax=Streptomyces sp. RFCAC02 TaxID=2499143 RepID=UPI0010207ABF|nr:aroma-sacti cluster domain-containing protein [Streptomyces sp. RFCAC02]
MTDRSRLAPLGLDPDGLSPEQLAALDSLTDEEIEVLVRIRHKIGDVAGDVEGHGLEGGGVVW